MSVHKSVCPHFVISSNVFSKIHHNAGGYDFLWFSASVCFFYIKFYVSPSSSYCWAIRPPLSFSFFSAPSLCIPSLCPHSGFISFSAYFSLSFCLICPSFCQAFSPCFLPAFYLSDFLCLTPSLPLPSIPMPPARPPFLFLSLKVLVADGSRALFTVSLPVSVSISGRSQSLSPRHRLPTSPRNKHFKWFPARGFCLRWGRRKNRKIEGLRNQLSCTID